MVLRVGLELLKKSKLCPFRESIEFRPADGQLSYSLRYCVLFTTCQCVTSYKIIKTTYSSSIYDGGLC
jgi:hypothetical protein